MTLRIGELFAGYGGLGMGVQSVIGGEVVWFSEFDAAPSKILAHHHPGVPNHGDITKIDWSTVEPVDVLTGGFPCQDVSLAGARKGLMEGTRSGLWSEFAKAIDALRPGLVVIENVRGLLSAKTVEDANGEAGNLEFGPAVLGELGRGDRPFLGAFGRVLGDLAELGYDAEWVGLRAADAGAPHGRYRVFIVAHPRGNEPERWGGFGDLGGTQAASKADGEERQRVWNTARNRCATATHPASCGCDRGPCEPIRRPIERAAAAGAGEDIAADASSERLGEHAGESPAEEAGAAGRDLADGPGGLRADTDWGPYRPAVEQWERVAGCLAPSPTERSESYMKRLRKRLAGKDKRPVGMRGSLAPSVNLAPRFVEWMMGIPAGHVTNPAIGLTRNEQLKALGNGVVPQQCALALRVLLSRDGNENA